MLGREAYHRPFVLAELYRALHPERTQPLVRAAHFLSAWRATRRGRLRRARGSAAITRHMLGLYGGEPGAREFSPPAKPHRARNRGRVRS